MNRSVKKSHKEAKLMTYRYTIKSSKIKVLKQNKQTLKLCKIGMKFKLSTQLPRIKQIM